MASKAAVATIIIVICMSAVARSESRKDHPDIVKFIEELHLNPNTEPSMEETLRVAREVMKNIQEGDMILEERPRRTIDLNLFTGFGNNDKDNTDDSSSRGLFSKDDAGSMPSSPPSIFNFIRNLLSRNDEPANERSLKERLSDRRSMGSSSQSNNGIQNEFTKLIRKLSDPGSSGENPRPRTSSTLKTLVANNPLFSKSRFSFRNSTFEKNDRDSRETSVGTDSGRRFAKNRDSRGTSIVTDNLGPLGGIVRLITKLLDKNRDSTEQAQRTGLRALLGSQRAARTFRIKNRDSRENSSESREDRRRITGSSTGMMNRATSNFLSIIIAQLAGIFNTILD